MKGKLAESRITSDVEVFVITVESSRSSDFVKIVLEMFSGGSVGLSSRIGGVWLNLRFVGLLRVSVEGKAFIAKRNEKDSKHEGALERFPEEGFRLLLI